MVRRLSEADRVELEARRERLRLELRLIEGELRCDCRRSLRNGGDKPTMQTIDDPFCTAKRAPCAVPSREFAGGSDGHRKRVRVVRAREQKHR
jgi:hypothetical protein